ncbi:MAG: SAM-dependent DNA methyltransferase [Bacteroidia bacterium]|nr:SAM-dependent DNA methyltransferase [Bacteroidia bacterium]
MNHTQHNQIVNFIWSIADDVLRDVYTRGKYRDIILPFTVLRRLDALLEPTKDKVLEMHEKLNKLKINNQAPFKKISGYIFYNASPYTFKKLLNEPANIRQNLENYLDGFSSNVQDIISKFKLRNQLTTMEEGNITFPLVEKFCSSQINLSPNPVKNKDGEIIHEGMSNLGMGYVFEELIRKFNEENNEEAGEHFTPREIIKLMTHLIFEPIKNKIKDGTYLIYDPACGSGGMLTEAENFAKEINPKATFHLYGQEVNPETFAICKADMLIKDEDPDKIAFGSTLSNDGFPNLQFDFMLTNPPYGKSWKIDQESILDKKGKEILDHRFKVGVPRVNDGQLLFVLNMVSKMKRDSELGSRIASVHNGSALFTGDAGQGESEIRKYLIEKDYLEVILALPNDLFYNTGIPTYIFVLNNRKEEKRKGKIQLLNVTSEKFYFKMRKPLGKKRVEFSAEHVNEITRIFLDFKENEYSRIFNNTEFGYSHITVHRPAKDEQGNIITDKKGNPKSDPNLKDIENIPLKDDIQEFFEREVLPFAPDAWYDDKETKIGYEINFAKYFYKHQPPRALDEIAADILAIQQETEGLLKNIIS